VPANPYKSFDQKRIVEVLARETEVPVAEVARLFEGERARLQRGARITGFLPIFAIRNVEEILRQRKVDSRLKPLPNALLEPR
jgi:hypothetical protein